MADAFLQLPKRLLSTRTPLARLASRLVRARAFFDVANRVQAHTSAAPCSPIAAPALRRGAAPTRSGTRSLSTRPSFVLPPAQTRALSIGSLATRLRLPSLRKHASDSPTDVAKQLKLFTELAEQDAVASHEEIVGRYEELTGIWTAAAAGEGVLKDDTAFRFYLTSLAVLAARGPDPGACFTKISDAAPKRLALLSGAAPAVVPDLASSTIATPTPAPTARSILSPSALMTALFSGPGGRGRGGDAKVVSTGAYGATLGTSTGGLGASEPIRVIVEEAKSPLGWRAARFILLTVVYSFLLRASEPRVSIPR